MLIHIHTQYRENYGDEQNPYWKFKGGSTFVVTDFIHPLNAEIGEAAEKHVAALRPKIEYSNPFSEEYILDWELTEAQHTEDEKLALKYDGKIVYPSPRISLASPDRT